MVFLVFTACSKEPEAVTPEAETVTAKAPYDTTAVDSFSAGAATRNIAQQIRRSSKTYQDSLRKIVLADMDQRRLQKENREKEEAVKKLQEERRKAETLKKKTENAGTASAPAVPLPTP